MNFETQNWVHKKSLLLSKHDPYSGVSSWKSLKTGNKEKNEEFDFFFITLSLSADLQGIYISYSKKNERSEKNMTWHTQW